MKSQILKRPLKLLMLFALGILLMQTETPAQQGSVSVSHTPTTASASQDDLVQMLNKALDEVGTSRVAIAALQSQLATYKQLHEADELIIGLKDQMLKSKDDIIEAQDKRYDRLAATKCTVTKWLWGIRSVKQCY